MSAQQHRSVHGRGVVVDEFSAIWWPLPQAHPDHVMRVYHTDGCRVRGHRELGRYLRKLKRKRRALA